MARGRNKNCKSCKYKSSKESVNGCDYICITGKSRGCSVEECDKYEKGKKLNSSQHWKEGKYL